MLSSALSHSQLGINSMLTCCCYSRGKHQILSLNEPPLYPMYLKLSLQTGFSSFSAHFDFKAVPVLPCQCCLQCWCLGTRKFRPNSRPWMTTATPSQRTLTSLQVSSPRATTFQVPCVFHSGGREHRESCLGVPNWESFCRSSGVRVQK